MSRVAPLAAPAQNGHCVRAVAVNRRRGAPWLTSPPPLVPRPVGRLGTAASLQAVLIGRCAPGADPRFPSFGCAGILMPKTLGRRMHNRSVESDAQRHCAASRRREHASRGAMPLRAAHLQR